MISLILSILTATSTTMLFVGNSYTFGNGGLWLMTDSVYESATDDTLLVLHHTSGGTAFKGHWNDPALQELIQNTEIDIAIFQEQSCMPVIDPQRTYTYGDSLAILCEANGIEPAFLMTWARKNDPLMLQGLSAGYSRMGWVNQCVVAPCGIGFELCRLYHPVVDPYAGDGAHPSLEGSYLASLIIASSVLGADISVPDVWQPEEIGYLHGAWLRIHAEQACSTYTQPMEVPLR